MNHLLLPLENVIQSYAWGSHRALASIRGESSPSEKPEAELWMGAHPSAPSRVVEDGTRRSLLELVEADPEGTLGEAARSGFHGRFPFLLKLLAAAEPLSLQAHPNQEQARAGFAREEAARPPIEKDKRNYKDANHKPELLCALTPFVALVGFRSVGETRRLLELLDAEPLQPLLEALAAEPAEQALRTFLELAMPPASQAERRAALARATLDACRRLSGKSDDFSRELAWGVRIGEKYPGDPGIVVALALNLVVLEPGQAIYLPAGNLHAYLEGTGVEIMASSDNVLRGGLTPKHVDVAELLGVLDFRSGPPKLVPIEQRGSEHVYLTPAPEFSLSRFELTGDAVQVGRVRGPEIVVTTDGSATLRRGNETLPLRSGASAFVPARGGDYQLTGTGTVFRARVNDPAHSTFSTSSGSGQRSPV